MSISARRGLFSISTQKSYGNAQLKFHKHLILSEQKGIPHALFTPIFTKVGAARPFLGAFQKSIGSGPRAREDFSASNLR